MTQIYNIVSIVAFSLAGVFFLISLFCWFKFDIWEIIGDLSGRNAKKSIQQMRMKNEKSSVNLYKPSGTYGGKGASADLSIRQSSTEAVTEDIMSVSVGSEETAILRENVIDDEADNATTILDVGETELLDSGATELLDEGTTILTTPGITLQKPNIQSTLTMLQSIVLIHTDEEIA